MFGSWQLGVGAFGSLWTVRRITDECNWWTLALGVRAEASVDLVDFGNSSSLYLALGGRFGGSDDFVCGGVASLGFRL